MTHDKRLVAENTARKAQAQLSRWLGTAAFRPLPAELPEGRFPDTHAPTGDLATHPQIEALRKSEDVTRFEAERARAERRPNWSWEVMYGQRQDGRADLATLQFSLPLLWNRARSPGPPAGKEACARRARAASRSTPNAS